MYFIKRFAVAMFALLLITSCEKEIDLDLDESPQKYVIEGIVHDSLADNYVLISKTRPFDYNGAIDVVSGANVEIKDNQGNTYSLYESSPGRYTDSTLLGVSGRTYTLKVVVDGITISGSSFMNNRSNIDSLSFELPNGPGGFGGIKLKCHFTDPANIDNYYRIKAFENGIQKPGFTNISDEYFDGNATFFPIREGSFMPGSIATVHLLTVDEVNYRYFSAISSSQGGDVPGNPVSNLDNDEAVGYFAAYAKSEIKVVIPNNLTP